MKILWLCNIMLPAAAEYLHMEVSHKEGWLSGLASVVLKRKQENGIELAAAFPASRELQAEVPVEGSSLICYGFTEDVTRPDIYDPALEDKLWRITEDFKPDVVHCFGTEYPHTLAMCRVFLRKDRILVGIQGLCAVYANTYFASLPDKVTNSATFRDILKRDTIRMQKEKFIRRGEMEKEAVGLAGNVTGRTPWDLHYTREWNPNASYFSMNETLRSNFYTGKWEESKCIPHSIFLSQGDYPVKGLHYMLLAMPKIRERFPDVKVFVAGADLTKYHTWKEKLKISAYGRYLRSLIRQYDLAQHVQFLGRLNADAMKEQYLRSSLFVCCSTIENSPNSLGEAMLLGMPCVSAAVGGIPGIFRGGEDGILYQGFRTPENSFDNVCNMISGNEALINGESENGMPENGVLKNGVPKEGLAGKDEPAEELSLEEIARNLADAVIEMWSRPEKRTVFCQNARNHAEITHNGEENYRKMAEIYANIVANGVENPSEADPEFVFVSNYISHHQIPFCNAMYRLLGGSFVFIQTEPMEEERRRMGWQESGELPYVKYYYKEPQKCRRWIDTARAVLFGGSDEESYITPRLEAGKPVIRYSERLYKSGQWKAVSPRGLIKKYHDHTRYRGKKVYMLCAGAYVPSDFHIIRAYPGKLLKWGYFPEMVPYDLQELMNGKKNGHILWAARFIDWKHPEMPLKTAKWLKDRGCDFHMDIIGGGEMEGTVKALLTEYDLSSHVTLLGYRTPEEVRGFMEKSDIFLLTSDRKEGWGAVVNEAMNSGCAVVGNHMAGAVPFLIRHGENGFIYRDGCEKQLFELVEKLLTDRMLCRKLGEAAVRTITEEWNSETAARRLVELCVREGFLERSQIKVSHLEENGVEHHWTDGPCSTAPVISERAMYGILMKQT